MLIGPMNALPWVLNGVVEAWISAGRICRLFEADNEEAQLTNQAFNEEDNQDLSQFQGDGEFMLRSPAVYWESTDNPILKDIDVVILKVLFIFKTNLLLFRNNC